MENQSVATDARHLIRLVERRSAERKRHPRNRCFAVLVAEEIAPRYLNVLHLISGSVPLVLMEMRMSVAAGTTTLQFFPVGLRLG